MRSGAALDRRPNRTPSLGPNWTGTCAIDAQIASPIKAPGQSTAVPSPVTSMPRSGYQPPPAHSSRARGRHTARQHSTPTSPLPRVASLSRPSRTSMHGVLASALIGAPSPQEDQRALDAHRSTAGRPPSPPLPRRASMPGPRWSNR